MIARVSCANAESRARRKATSEGVARRIFSTRSGMPMTPVEQTSTSSFLQPSSRATLAAVLRDAASPSGPVAQLAFPEFTITARMRLAARRRCSRETITGAACTRFLVKTHAAEAGTSLASSARSRLDRFSPHAVAEKENPRGSAGAGGSGFIRQARAQPSRRGWAMQRARDRQ